jgi:hypothetical protein
MFSLGLTEDDQDIVTIIEEAWDYFNNKDKKEDYFNNKDKKEWVEWAGTILMPKFHSEMEMEKVATRRVQVKAERIERIRKEEQKQEQE